MTAQKVLRVKKCLRRYVPNGLSRVDFHLPRRSQTLTWHLMMNRMRKAAPWRLGVLCYDAPQQRSPTLGLVDH